MKKISLWLLVLVAIVLSGCSRDALGMTEDNTPIVSISWGDSEPLSEPYVIDPTETDTLLFSFENLNDSSWTAVYLDGSLALGPSKTNMIDFNAEKIEDSEWFETGDREVTILYFQSAEHAPETIHSDVKNAHKVEYTVK